MGTQWYPSGDEWISGRKRGRCPRLLRVSPTRRPADETSGDSDGRKTNNPPERRHQRSCEVVEQQSRKKIKVLVVTQVQ